MANIIGSSLYAYPWVAPSPTIAAGEYWFKEELDLTAAGGGLEQAIEFTTPNGTQVTEFKGIQIVKESQLEVVFQDAEGELDQYVYSDGLGWQDTAARLISVTTDTTVSKEFYNWFIANTYTSPFDMTYTGTYNVRDDGVVELLTSGTLVFLNPAVIDVFMVGGGGKGGSADKTGSVNYHSVVGGGGGGYTGTFKGVSVQGSYQIAIGAGATVAGTDGGATRWGTNFAVNGGTSARRASSAPTNSVGAGFAGGSGGGGGVLSNSDYGAGGSNGANGEQGYFGGITIKGGEGQGSTTREFGEATGKLYAGGGGGGRAMMSNVPIVSIGGSGGGGTGGFCYYTNDVYQAPTAGGANTGGGGGGCAASYQRAMEGGSGGSGICCFRAAK